MAKKLKKRQKNKPKQKSVSTFGIQPLSDGVLIQPVARETTTPSGIIIPDTAKEEKTTIGVIVAIGPGKKTDEGRLIPMSVAVGQKVYFNPGWDNEVEWKGEKYHLVHESDVKGILN